MAGWAYCKYKEKKVFWFLQELSQKYFKKIDKSTVLPLLRVKLFCLLMILRERLIISAIEVVSLFL